MYRIYRYIEFTKCITGKLSVGKCIKAIISFHIGGGGGGGTQGGTQPLATAFGGTFPILRVLQIGYFSDKQPI